MKHILIIANGEAVPKEKVAQLITDDTHIICTDGGYQHCAYYNLTPHVIIGDFDSFKGEKVADDIKKIERPDQNSSDMQKALKYAYDLNPTSIDIINCFGRRNDHTLSNLFILNALTFSFPVKMHDAFGFYFTLKPGWHAFRNNRNQHCSIFALDDVDNVQTTGFAFPVNREMLKAPFNGSSNQIISDNATISFDQGKVLIYLLDKNYVD